jgi:hypothetical protein
VLALNGHEKHYSDRRKLGLPLQKQLRWSRHRAGVSRRQNGYGLDGR